MKWKVIVTCMKIMKTKNEKTNLNLNPNTKHRNQHKSQNVKDKNMKYAKQKCKEIFIVIKYET